MFVVFYKKERNGKIFTFVENADHTKTFLFPMIDKTVICQERQYKEIDDALCECFHKVVGELG